MARKDLTLDGSRGEMLKFDARLIYRSTVLIIDFGPDDPEAEREAFYWGNVVRAESMKEVEIK